MKAKIKLVDPTPENLAQQVRDIAATPHTPMPDFPEDWLERGMKEEAEECEACTPRSLDPEPAHTNAKLIAPELTYENLSSMTLVDLKVLWDRLFVAMKADGCTGFHATPNMEALEKLPSDTERERHWLIGVMGMLGANFRGEYEDVTETLL